MATPYSTLTAPVDYESEIRRSRFLCALAPAPTEAEARAFVAEVSARHKDATHNCSAYVIGGDRSVRRADDDGEPSGTAGPPMLDALVKQGLSDVVTVVTRYFGGVLLGAGGLVRAYGGAVSRAVAEAGERGLLIRMVPARVVAVRIGHAHAGRLENDLRASPYPVRGVAYGADVTVEAAVREDDLESFLKFVASLTAGRAVAEPGRTVYVPGGEDNHN
ncbi:IMPACT family protein [Sinosporangium siamense]|uniref:YigZ family protein n=1 Tax=Sinosporangium siamense TaxID=1367973 RepID=A0A919VBC2_9ACTN|nr:YigZ family protein [Sinosporangium siamense]GII97426.1 YigZ family protein [Sinosporangium siamense]